ncbi:MAG TPA: hypothetical protein VFG23_07420 [Polyangia bacterium]|nr:hypothetical protein [Polyangia bacterium]
MWSSYSNLESPKARPVRPPVVHYPSWTRRFTLAREASLTGARLLRYRQRRKTVVTAIWCLAVSIAAITIACLIMPS